MTRLLGLSIFNKNMYEYYLEFKNGKSMTFLADEHEAVGDLLVLSMGGEVVAEALYNELTFWHRRKKN